MDSETKVSKSEYRGDGLKEEMESLLPKKPPTDQAPNLENESTSITIGEDDNAGSIELMETAKPKTEESQNTTSYGSIAPSAQTDVPNSASTPATTSGATTD